MDTNIDTEPNEPNVGAELRAENNLLVDDSSDNEDEPIQEGDHKAKVEKTVRDRIKAYKKEQKKGMPVSD